MSRTENPMEPTNPASPEHRRASLMREANASPAGVPSRGGETHSTKAAGGASPMPPWPPIHRLPARHFHDDDIEFSMRQDVESALRARDERIAFMDAENAILRESRAKLDAEITAYADKTRMALDGCHAPGETIWDMIRSCVQARKKLIALEAENARLREASAAARRDEQGEAAHALELAGEILDDAWTTSEPITKERVATIIAKFRSKFHAPQATRETDIVRHPPIVIPAGTHADPRTGVKNQRPLVIESVTLKNKSEGDPGESRSTLECARKGSAAIAPSVGSATPSDPSHAAGSARVIALIEKAERHVADLCDGRARWTMSVPVQRDRDSDTVIVDALEAAKKALFAPPAPVAVTRERIMTIIRRAARGRLGRVGWRA